MCIHPLLLVNYFMRLLLMQDLIFHNKKIDYKMSDDDGGRCINSNLLMVEL